MTWGGRQLLRSRKARTFPKVPREKAETPRWLRRNVLGSIARRPIWGRMVVFTFWCDSYLINWEKQPEGWKRLTGAERVIELRLCA